MKIRIKVTQNSNNPKNHKNLFYVEIHDINVDNYYNRIGDERHLFFIIPYEYVGQMVDECYRETSIKLRAFVTRKKIDKLILDLETEFEVEIINNLV